ncbi:unnamed protein product [Arctia plantaginis]|uniref:Uncharacterized protein n=1 Tax=Arctia plantaginis TaxID=874455 RepID=A0A8S0ZN49_ARCPL|nr:unnamed protein product [Arctia plantaginis]CAB3253315.1 unnamed protein product [Arctia plantaginis]
MMEIFSFVYYVEYSPSPSPGEVKAKSELAVASNGLNPHGVSSQVGQWSGIKVNPIRLLSRTLTNRGHLLNGGQSGPVQETAQLLYALKVEY